MGPVHPIEHAPGNHPNSAALTRSTTRGREYSIDYGSYNTNCTARARNGSRGRGYSIYIYLCQATTTRDNSCWRGHATRSRQASAWDDPGWR
jgi:hypothetical protein